MSRTVLEPRSTSTDVISIHRDHDCVEYLRDAYHGMVWEARSSRLKTITQSSQNELEKRKGDVVSNVNVTCMQICPCHASHT